MTRATMTALRQGRSCAGFTLLEALVVVAILAALAGIGVSVYRGVLEDADERLVVVEMREIAKALRQFKEDTGYYPKEGPFALAASGGLISYSQLRVDYDEILNGYTDAEIRRWFSSPANFYQLLTATSPLEGTGHHLENWSFENGSGWRGPYLHGIREYTDVGDGLGINGTTGDIVEIDVDEIVNVWGIADPFDHFPAVQNSYIPCTETEANDADCILDWRLAPSDGADAPNPGDDKDKPYVRYGRPFLFFTWQYSVADPHDDEYWLVSMGPDGEYCPNGDFDCEFTEDEDNITLQVE